MVEFPVAFPFWTRAQYWAVGIITSLLFFASVLLHELSHSVVAIRSGIPVKGITLFIFGGVSQIGKEAQHPGTEAKVAIAGPGTSLALAAAFWALSVVARPLNEQVFALARWLAVINAALAVFNMIPGFPLDGGRVLRAALWGLTGSFSRASRIATLAGQGISYLFILLGIVWVFNGNWIGGLWLVFIGWFLENAASASYRQVMLREALSGYSAGELMTRDCAYVPGDITVRTLVEEHVLRTTPDDVGGGRRCFLVSKNDTLQGIITLTDVKKIPRNRWDTTLVSDAMTAAEKVLKVRISDNAFSVLEQMDERDINQMPVMDDGGKVVGMIGRDNLIRFIRARSELGMQK